VVAVEDDLHPLTGLRSAYYIAMRQPLEDIASPIRRFFIRLIYFKWDWNSGASIHGQGIFTDREVAEEVAARKRLETGMAWSVKELPVNGLLSEEAVQYGFYSFPGSPADARYRNRVIEFAAIPKNDLEQLAEVENKLITLADRIERKCARAT